MAADSSSKSAVSSKVPAGRLARFGSFAALAGRVAGNMLAEGSRQLLQGQKPDKTALLLTADNIRQVADQLAHLRGAAMKIGQLLSMDGGDLLPRELTDLLARLRANANPMPAKQLTAVLRAELGADWLDHFSDFSFNPLAAASIGQVHAARHDDGRSLAVKIQYPGVRESIDSDVDNVAMLLRVSGLLPASLDYQSLLQAAKQQLKAEADYQQEAAYLSRYRALLADDAAYLLPEPLPALCSGQLLTMTYVDGVAIETLQHDPQSTRDRVMQLLFALLFRELFEFSLVQTDPNFANYRYNRQTGQLVLLDFGACRSYPPSFGRAYAALFRASLTDDRRAMTAALREIGFFSQHILPAQLDTVLTIVTMATEPLRAAQPYDFAQTDLASRLRQAGLALSTQQHYWHTPPVDALFLHRKIAGLYLLAARLGARVDVRALLLASLPSQPAANPA